MIRRSNFGRVKEIIEFDFDNSATASAGAHNFKNVCVGFRKNSYHHATKVCVHGHDWGWCSKQQLFYCDLLIIEIMIIDDH